MNGNNNHPVDDKQHVRSLVDNLVDKVATETENAYLTVETLTVWLSAKIFDHFLLKILSHFVWKSALDGPNLIFCIDDSIVINSKFRIRSHLELYSYLKVEILPRK